MKAEAINALQLFKQKHLSRQAVEATNEQADMVSESPASTEENQMELRNPTFEEVQAEWEQVGKDLEQPKQKRNINYPDHIKPLKDRIMSALNNGARTGESVASYCKEEVKLINMQLGRWVSRGLIGRKVSQTGVIRYYPYALAKQMGILIKPQPINRRTLVEIEKKRSLVQTKQPTQTKENPIEGKDYVSFLEKRIVQWQDEARKMAKQISELENEVVKARAEVVKAKTEPRNVTGEVQEVMKEVMELRATVAYLESKLFGSK